jgi:hypothetical protein
MSFIDTLKSLFGGKKENVQNIVVPSSPVVETPVMTPAPEPMIQTPVEEIHSEPVVHTMESDMSVEAPVVEAPVIAEEVSTKVDAVVDQVNADLGNISTETTTENQ